MRCDNEATQPSFMHLAVYIISIWLIVSRMRVNTMAENCMSGCKAYMASDLLLNIGKVYQRQALQQVLLGHQLRLHYWLRHSRQGGVLVRLVK